MKTVVAALAAALIAAAPAAAKPNSEEIARFQADIAKRRADFEAKLKASPPGERARERLEYAKKRQDARRRLDSRLVRTPASRRGALFEEYYRDLKREEQEHHKRMAKLEPDKSTYETERAEFERELNRRMREFYGD